MEGITRRAFLGGAAVLAFFGCSAFSRRRRKRRAERRDAVGLVHRKVGAVTPTAFVVAAKTKGETFVRLRVSTNPDLSDATLTAAATPDAQGMVKIPVTGLQPNTRYYYGWRLSGVNSDDKPGSCKTLQDGPHSFAFAFGSCLGNDQDGSVFAAIRAREPAFLLYLGDLVYNDFTDAEATAANYRAAYDELFSRSLAFHKLAARCPLVYAWSDHDYQINNVQGDTAGRVPAQRTYRQHLPHYPLVEGSAIYHSFEVGRVLFVVLDSRSQKSPQDAPDDAQKTVLGDAQKQWLKDLVLANKDRPKVLCMDGTWNAAAPTANSENWASYATERDELVGFFADNGIRNLLVLTGDAHMVAADDGTNSPGGIPTFSAAPFGHRAVVHDGPWTHGPVPAVSGGPTIKQYGWVDVRDEGPSGGVTLTFTAHAEDGTVLLDPLTVAMDAETAP